MATEHRGRRWWPFGRSPRATGAAGGPGEPGDHTDTSLRASSETYEDRQRESEVILERLDRSSSSVIGIAGVRGAGKSSLALKVLDRCAGKGYFKLMIPSPIGYDAQEFLVSLYQRVCEGVIAHLSPILGDVTSLDAMGRAEVSRLRRRFWLIMLGGLALTIASGGYALVQWAKVTSAERSANTLRLKQTADSLARRADELDKEVARLKLGKDTESLSRAEANSMKARQWARDAAEEVSFFEARAAATVVYGTFIPLTVAILLSYGALIVGWIVARRTRVRYRRLRLHPRETGLYQRAQQNLEYLRYQATLKTSQEVGGTLHGLAAKLTRGKDLAMRPLSLPGISAECNVFLSQVADVMGGKVVLCLDELDKIADPEQLASLLRGVKGLFGQPRSYFLLTVSEDALSAFAARRQGDRNILESSFEDILYLDRVSVPLARLIVSRMLGVPAAETAAPFQDNCVLLWALGFGIPREIKRNVLICESAGRRVVADDPREVWRTLYLALIESLRRWTLAALRDEVQSYVALRCLDETTARVQACALDEIGASKCSTEIVTVCAGYSHPDDEIGVPVAPAAGPVDTPDTQSSIRRVVLELQVGLLPLLGVALAGQPRDEWQARIAEVFPFVGSSPRFAARKTRMLLTDLGVVERLAADGSRARGAGAGGPARSGLK